MYIELTHCSCYISSSYLVVSPLMWVGQAPHIIHTSDTITQSPSHTYRYSPAHTPQPLTAHKHTHIHTRRYTAVQVNTKWYSKILNSQQSRNEWSLSTSRAIITNTQTTFVLDGDIGEWMDDHRMDGWSQWTDIGVTSYKSTAGCPFTQLGAREHSQPENSAMCDKYWSL